MQSATSGSTPTPPPLASCAVLYAKDELLLGMVDGVAAEQQYVEEHCGRSWVEFEQQRPSRIWMRHEWEVVCIFRLCITMCADLMQLQRCDAASRVPLLQKYDDVLEMCLSGGVVLVCRIIWLCIDIRVRGRTLTGQSRARVLWVQSVSKVKTYEALQPCSPLSITISSAGAFLGIDRQKTCTWTGGRMRRVYEVEAAANICFDYAARTRWGGVEGNCLLSCLSNFHLISTLGR